MESHLLLVGYRGSGKSSVGRQIGEILGLSNIDSDDWIEKEAGKSIREIFTEFGEQYFRDLEAKAIEQIVQLPIAAIVSLGGGVVLRESNRRLIAVHGRTVWLKASANLIAERLANDLSTAERRPALTQLTNFDEIVSLLEVREPLYQSVANFIVTTDHRSVYDIAAEVASWYSKQHST